MLISSRDFLGLPAVTESGTRIGRVVALHLDIESHAVARYVVRSRPWSAKGELLIAPADVVSITKERMTVRDAAVRAAEGVRVRSKPITTVSPVAPRSVDLKHET